MAGKAEQDFSVLQQMVKWLGLSDDEGKKFTSEMMSRRGHKMVPSWIDGDDSGKNNEPDNIFGISLGGNKDKGNGPGWQYGA